MGDSRAGDRQDESDGAEQDPKRQSNVLDEGLAEGLDAESLIGLDSVRKLIPEVLRRDLKACLGLLDSDAGFEPSGDLEIMALVGVIGVELERYPDFRSRSELLEVEAVAD